MPPALVFDRFLDRRRRWVARRRDSTGRVGAAEGVDDGVLSETGSKDETPEGTSTPELRQTESESPGRASDLTVALYSEAIRWNNGAREPIKSVERLRERTPHPTGSSRLIGRP